MGGTNFGFMNGARVVTSYDYDAPLTESGNYTDKYYETRALYDTLTTSGRMPTLALPDSPPPVPLAQYYGSVNITQWLALEKMLPLSWQFNTTRKPIAMELLNQGVGYGQRFGFVLYRLMNKPVKKFEITGS